MWIDKRGRQHRVYYRTGLASPKRAFEAFESREEAERFIGLARLSSLAGAIAYVRDPRPDALDELLGLSVATAATARVQGPVTTPAGGTTAAPAANGAATPGDAHLVGMTFAELWHRFLQAQRQLEETTAEDYASYGKFHLLPFFGDLDLGLIHRTAPLRPRDAVTGAVYVDDWVDVMMGKERCNSAGNPMAGTRLSLKFISNVLTVLGQTFDVAIQARPALLEVNPAREIRLPKQDRREMHFLEDEKAYLALRCAMNAHFQPLLDFLVGTGARFGEAAGLLTRHVHLDAPRPYVEIRLVLKWFRKRYRLGRPKTKASVRRISLSPRLVEILRPLIEGKGPDEHVFTMVEGGPLHHGNFTNRYFKPAVKAAGKAVPARLRIHDLRHTHAAWLISDGVPMLAVQRRLGHSSYNTTADVYGHLTPEADDRTLAVIDRRLPDVLARDDQGAELVSLTKQEKQLPEFDDVDDLDDLAA